MMCYFLFVIIMHLRKIVKVVQIRKWLINLPMSFFIENCKLKDSAHLVDGKRFKE